MYQESFFRSRMNSLPSFNSFLLLVMLLIAEYGCVSVVAVCPAGKYVYVYDGKCYDCPAGSYTASGGLSSCTFCPAGKYQPNVGSTGCLDCEKGYFNYPGNYYRTSCSICNYGTYNDVKGASYCIDCPAGKFKDNFPGSNITACTLCGPGK